MMVEMVNPLLVLGAAFGLAFLLAALFWPGRGLVSRWQHAQKMSARVRHEDVLKQVYKLETKGQPVTVAAIAGATELSQDATAGLLGEMEAAGLLVCESGQPCLTPEGREAALHIIRAHRLWETYLAEETGFGEADWHALAEAEEHGLSPADLQDLAARLSFPTYDPHGDPIPAPGGELVSHGGVPLATLSADTLGRIVHLEDEPAAVYAQLVAEELSPGMPVRVTHVSAERVRFWANGDEHVLAPVVAANIFVLPLVTPDEAIASDAQPLSGLALGESAAVVALAPGLRGQERRRLLDLGLVPGTEVTAELRSPGGDPTAYRIRGATIALRREQAHLVKVRPLNAEREAAHD